MFLKKASRLFTRERHSSMPVILSVAKNLSLHTEILRCAQNDRQRDWCLARNY